MPKPRQAPIIGTDVRLYARPDKADRRIEDYRVASDGTVYVHCHFTNWGNFTNNGGIPPGGTWTQFRKLGAQNGPLARRARHAANLIAAET